LTSWKLSLRFHLLNCFPQNFIHVQLLPFLQLFLQNIISVVQQRHQTFRSVGRNKRYDIQANLIFGHMKEAKKAYVLSSFSGIRLNEQPLPTSVWTGTNSLLQSVSTPSHMHASKIDLQSSVFYIAK